MNADEFQVQIDELKGQLGANETQISAPIDTDSSSNRGSVHVPETAGNESVNDIDEEVDDKEADERERGRQFIKDEEIQTGQVEWSDYSKLFSHAPGGKCGIILIILMHIIINLSTTGVSLFLSFALTKKFSEDLVLNDDEKDARDVRYNIALASIIGVALFTSFVGKYISNLIFMRINKKLHGKIVNSVLNTNLVFFEQNTQGRILNRFSKDIQTLDYLVFDFLEMIDYFTKCFFSLAMVIYIIPLLTFVVILSLVYLISLRRRCVLVT